MYGHSVMLPFTCGGAVEKLNTYCQVSLQITADRWQTLCDLLIVNGPF